MRDYKVKIIQMTILTILITLLYFDPLPKTDEIGDVTLEDVNYIIKYGKEKQTFVGAGDKDATLIYTNDELELQNKLDIDSTIFGETVSTSENMVYINNFHDIYMIDGEKSVQYTSTIDEYLLDIIYDNHITITSSYAEDNYYHSIARVSLESTINYPVEASIITQIKNGKRHDVLVYEAVEAITYNNNYNFYYMFYTSSNTKDAIYSFNDLICSRLVFDYKSDTYVHDPITVSQGHKLSEHGITYISPIIDENFKIYFSKEVGLSDRQIYNYYIATFNEELMEIENEKVITSKEIMNDSSLEVVETFVIDNNLYVFFSNLKYNVINLNTNEIKEYIVTQTGKITSINYSTDGKDIYVILTTEKNVSVAKLIDGIPMDLVTIPKSNFKFGLFDYSAVLDFNVLMD